MEKNKSYLYKRQEPLWGIVWSTLAFIIGFGIPELIKRGWDDTSKAHEPIWVVIALYSGLTFLVIEKIFHGLHQVTENQEEIGKELKRSLEMISTSIAAELKAEKTIMRIPFNNSETYKYIKSLVELHDSVSETNSNEKIITHALTILRNGTLSLMDFFSSNKNGGLYRIQDAVQLYGQLAKTAASLTIIEPKYIMRYKDNYTTGYTDFIKSLSSRARLKRKYIFLSGNISHGDTSEWLKGNKFEVKCCGIEGIPTDDDRKWSEYSHLLFGFDNYFVSCSVLPLFNSDKVEEIATSPSAIQNFKKAEYFYLAFRIINAEQTEATNGDRWFANLLKYHNQS